MNREQLEELSKKELIEHAEVQGVKITAQIDTKGTIIDKILGDYRPSTKVAEPQEPKLGSLHDLQGNKIKTAMYKLTIFSTENDKNDVDLILLPCKSCKLPNFGSWGSATFVDGL